MIADGSKIGVCQVEYISYNYKTENLAEQRATPNEYSYTDLSTPYIASIRWDAHHPVYDREVLDCVGGFRENLAVGQGFEWVARCRCKKFKTSFLPFRYYYYRQDVPGRLTSSNARRIASNRLKISIYIERLLRAHHVRNHDEWVALIEYTLRTSYRAQLSGLSRQSRLNFLFARRLRSELSNGSVRLKAMLLVPWMIMKALFQIRVRLLQHTK